jgi:hypothetical protein
MTAKATRYADPAIKKGIATPGPLKNVRHDLSDEHSADCSCGSADARHGSDHFYRK